MYQKHISGKYASNSKELIKYLDSYKSWLCDNITFKSRLFVTEHSEYDKPIDIYFVFYTQCSSITGKLLYNISKFKQRGILALYSSSIDHLYCKYPLQIP